MIRNTTWNDIETLAANARPEDKREVIELAGLSITEAGAYGLIAGKILTGTVDDEVACVFGYVPTDSDTASAWLLSTPKISKATRELITEGRRLLDEWCEDYTLKNLITADNTVHLRLASALGFTLGDATENNGPLRVKAIPIERPQKCAHPQLQA